MRFNLYEVFTAWYLCTSRQPDKKGWYRVKTKPMTGPWWDGMAFWTGSDWRVFRQSLGDTLSKNWERVEVSHWQGLRCAAADAAKLIRAHLPSQPNIRSRWLEVAQALEAPTTAPVFDIK